MPPARGNSAATSAKASAPHSATAAPTTHTSSIAPGVPVWAATAAGTRNTPLPIMIPTVTAAVDQAPSRRGNRSAPSSRSAAGARGSMPAVTSFRVDGQDLKRYGQSREAFRRICAQVARDLIATRGRGVPVGHPAVPRRLEGERFRRVQLAHGQDGGDDLPLEPAPGHAPVFPPDGNVERERPPLQVEGEAPL